jgi:hypothetical protein
MVGYGYYYIINNSLIHNYEETIHMTRIAGSMVKTMKQEVKVDNILPYYYDAFAYSIFI